MRTMLKSFRHAINGFLYAFRNERNFQIELAFAFFVLGAAFLFPLQTLERALLFGMIALILSLELMNTAFERMLDMLKPQVHPYVKVIKDLVAGSVLIGALFAFLVGISIFLPYFL